MKNMLLAMTLLFATAAASVQADPPPVKLVLSPASTIPNADIVENLSKKCPNVALVLDSTKSDYMLEAIWTGQYRFTLFKKGGQAVFSTRTQMLSNAVKDTCHYVNSQK